MIYFSIRKRRLATLSQPQASCIPVKQRPSADVSRSRIQLLHLLTRRLAERTPATDAELQQLTTSNGQAPELDDVVFVLKELRYSPAVNVSNGIFTLADKRAACRAVHDTAFPSTQTWQSKEEVLEFFKQAIVSMAEVTGINEVTVAYQLQSNLGSLVAAMLELVSISPSIATSAPASAPSCMLAIDDCSDTVLTCPCCNFAVCSACHMARHNTTAFFPMLDDQPTHQRFEHEGIQQSFAFFCCARPSCGALLPPNYWQTLMKGGIADPGHKLPEAAVTRCARLVSRVARHHTQPLIVSCQCSRFFWQPKPQQPVHPPLSPSTPLCPSPPPTPPPPPPLPLPSSFQQPMPNLLFVLAGCRQPLISCRQSVNAATAAWSLFQYTRIRNGALRWNN